MLALFLFFYTISFDSPVMDNVEYLQVKGLIDIPSIRPYEMRWLVSQIDELLLNDGKLNKVDRKIISSFNPFLIKKEDFSTLFHLTGTYQSSPELYYGLTGYRLGGRLADNIEYSHGGRIRRASKLDSLAGQKWRNFQPYMNEGLITFHVERTRCDIGRRNFLLGPGDDNSLLLSLDPQGYDGFLLFIPFRYFEFYKIFSVLNAARNRYLSIHRIGLNIRRFLKLGFSEAILFSESLEPLYLNPLLPYYLSQWGIDRDDNIMWCFDAQLSLYNSVIYGEFLIDDYMYEDDPYPHKTAYKIGFKSLILNNFLVKMNYTFVDKWVYTHKRLINTYVRDTYVYLPDSGFPVGFPLGNDVDQVSFSIKFMNQYGLYPGLYIKQVRKGEGSIYLPYTEEGGSLNPPFPSGVVEKKFDILVGLDYIFKYNFFIETHVGKRYWTNKGHISADDTDDFLFDISLWVVL
jgi:hypothetical protein